MKRMLIVLVAMMAVSTAALGAVTNDKGRIVSQDTPKPTMTTADNPIQKLFDGFAQMGSRAERPQSLTGMPARAMTNDKGRRL